VPGVRLELAGRRMVAGDDQHIRVELEQLGQGLIDAFDDVDLAVEVAVFAVAVGLLDMDEEEVVVVPGALDRFEFIARASRPRIR
jgi:hypothetical protein